METFLAMEDKNFKYEHAKFIIDRYDHYYEGVNSKGAFYIGLNTFILGGICVGFISLHTQVNTDNLFWGMGISLILFISNFISTLFTILALKPFLKENCSDEQHKSLIYFGSIANQQLQIFKKRFDEADENSIQEDLVEQLHCLATGLKQKYFYLRISGQILLIQFLTIIPLLFLIAYNLKS